MKYFFSIFLILFIFFPTTYLYVSIIQTDKRTDYPGKKIAKIVQENWTNNFKNKIGLVGGDVWHGGNLFYNLKSKPKWDNIFETKKIGYKKFGRFAAKMLKNRLKKIWPLRGQQKAKKEAKKKFAASRRKRQKK